MASVATPAAVSSSTKGYNGALPTPPATMSARLQPSGRLPAATDGTYHLHRVDDRELCHVFSAEAEHLVHHVHRARLRIGRVHAERAPQDVGLHAGTFTCTNCPGRAVDAISGARTVMSQMLHPISSFTRMGAFSLQSVIGSPVASAEKCIW